VKGKLIYLSVSKLYLMRTFLLLLICTLLTSVTFSQASSQGVNRVDSIKLEKQRAEKARMDKLIAGMTYPVVHGTDRSGVIDVKDFTETTDTSMVYKILFDWIEFNPDSLAAESNQALNEIAHKINLHIAAGIPLKNFKFVVIVHGPALKAATNNQFYRDHYKVDNPNIKIIEQMVAAGGKFIACGQAMAFQGLERKMLMPQIGVAFTAQTSLSYYQMKGYIKFDAKRL
jgi:intracellular sulfur oxidation DsrE/DsrF family protein